MQARKIERFLTKSLAPHLPEFTVGKRMLYREPVAPILRGFYFDNSGSPDHFYTWVFVLPLYVRHEELSFGLGKRLDNRQGFLRSRQTWQLEDHCRERTAEDLLNAIRKQGLPYLRGLGTPAGLVVNLGWKTRHWFGPRVREAVAYSLAACSRYRLAELKLRVLKHVVKGEAGCSDLSLGAQALLDAIAAGPAEVEALLARWTAESISNLGLGLPKTLVPEQRSIEDNRKATGWDGD